MIEVNLSYREMMHANLEASMRQIESLKKGLRDRNDAPKGKGWEYHIIGALGELAVAKHLGKYWGGSSGFKARDVLGCEVRTRKKHHFDLILRDSDPTGVPFVLVTGVSNPFQIHGWINAEEGRKNEWLTDHSGRPPAYFVPQSALSPMDTMLEEEWLKQLPEIPF